jgi:hypothetical protein
MLVRRILLSGGIRLVHIAIKIIALIVIAWAEETT